MCMVCHPTVFYLSTRLAGCSVGPEINRGVRKLARTPQVIYIKKTDVLYHLQYVCFHLNPLETIT